MKHLNAIVAYHMIEKAKAILRGETEADSVKRVVRPIPREELKTAMMKDFEQHMIDSYTPDRGYPFPVDNVEALISKYWPNNSSAQTR